MTKQLSVNIKPLSSAEYGEFLAQGKMSAGEKAARLYLGKKQAKKMARLNRVFIGAWIALIIGAIVAPFILFWGV